ncbi:methionyl-tRNA formyltransferase [Clostridium akagii]|uniref:methionyl-tRNA formyltransferase n=1 Tax=Clostridium akagii TaxID=91623 RepID=UPI0005680356|nr:methionyl-tRNA formyltransferase [Clostridium akagii]
MGTPDFSVPSLKKVIENYNVKAVFTQPDKPKGRGKKMCASPVKEVALQSNIKVYQPVKIKNESEIIDKIRKIKPDFIIVVAYGQILSKEILDIPKYACINLHASLLPKLRGAAPINWAIINGEKFAGNTTMLMGVGLDTGDMLLRQQVEITEEMTAGDLYHILRNKGADLLVETIDKYSKGIIEPEKQKDELSNYAPMITKNTGKIIWNSASKKIENLIKGLNPNPLAYTSYKGNIMKIHKAKSMDVDSKKVPGTVLKADKMGILVACKEGSLLINVIQFPGKKAMNVEDYIRGNDIEEETVLV